MVHPCQDNSAKNGLSGSEYSKGNEEKELTFKRRTWRDAWSLNTSKFHKGMNLTNNLRFLSCCLRPCYRCRKWWIELPCYRKLSEIEWNYLHRLSNIFQRGFAVDCEHSLFCFKIRGKNNQGGTSRAREKRSREWSVGAGRRKACLLSCLRSSSGFSN